MFGKRDDRAATIEPLSSHLVTGGATIPEAVVGLRGAKDDEEANQETEATPSGAVVENLEATFRRPWKNACVVDGKRQGTGQETTWTRCRHSLRKDASLELEELPAGASAVVMNHGGEKA